MYRDLLVAKHRAFDKAICDLRVKYPDFYIEYWSPLDVVKWIDDSEMSVTFTMTLDEVVERVIEILYEEFDASRGTNWNAIKMAVNQVVHEQGETV